MAARALAAQKHQQHQGCDGNPNGSSAQHGHIGGDHATGDHGACPTKRDKGQFGMR